MCEVCSESDWETGSPSLYDLSTNHRGLLGASVTLSTHTRPRSRTRSAWIQRTGTSTGLICGLTWRWKQARMDSLLCHEDVHGPGQASYPPLNRCGSWEVNTPSQPPAPDIAKLKVLYQHKPGYYSKLDSNQWESQGNVWTFILPILYAKHWMNICQHSLFLFWNHSSLGQMYETWKGRRWVHPLTLESKAQPADLFSLRKSQGSLSSKCAGYISNIFQCNQYYPLSL